MSDIALYIHFPFCRRRCYYCSFVSYASREANIPAYVSAVKWELAQRAANQAVRSIYFGGGTPSLLSPVQVGDVLESVRSSFTGIETAEITMEANPGTVDEPYFAAIRELGVDRLSLGVQSLDDSGLQRLGRIHSADEARQAVRAARKAGFTNLSLDLIYGIPCQTVENWQKTLQEIIRFRPEHLSLYALSLDDNAPMKQAIDRGELPALDADLAADQYETAEGLLAAEGYRHYEISSWSLPGYECRHNLIYWKNLSYLGVGVAAHSSLNGHRLANTRDLDKYLEAFTRKELPSCDLDEEIGPELKISESIILGLRLSEGVDIKELRDRFGVNLKKVYHRQIEEMTGHGLLEYYDNHLRLTHRGRLLANEVFWRFLPE